MYRLNTQLCLSLNITGSVPVFHKAQVVQSTFSLHYYALFTYSSCSVQQYNALLSVQLCAGPLSQSMYLGIFETEMTHVVVDQAKGKAPVHEGQAPLGRESGISTHAAQV